MKKILYGIIGSLALTTSLYSTTALEQLQLVNQKILVDGIISKTTLLGNSIGQYIVNTGGYPSYNISQDKLTYDNIDSNKIEMYKYSNLTSNYLSNLDGTPCITDAVSTNYCRSDDTQGIDYLIKYDSLNKIPIGISFYPESILGNSILDFNNDKIIAQLNLNGIVYKSGKLIKYFSDTTLATIKQSYFILSSNPTIQIKDVSETTLSSRSVGDIVYSPDGNGGFLIFMVDLDTSGNKYWKAYGEPQVILTAYSEDALESINSSINDEITILNPGGIAITYTAQGVTTTDTGAAQTTWQMSNGAFTKNYSDGTNDLLFMTQTNVDYTSKITNTCNYTASKISGLIPLVIANGNLYRAGTIYKPINGDYGSVGVVFASTIPFQNSVPLVISDGNLYRAGTIYKPINGNYGSVGTVYLSTTPLTNSISLVISDGNLYRAGTIYKPINGDYGSVGSVYDLGSVYSCPNGGTLNGSICEKSCTSSYPAVGGGDITLYNDYNFMAGMKNGTSKRNIDGNLVIFASRNDGGFGSLSSGNIFNKIYTWNRSGLHQPETGTFNIGGQTYVIRFMRGQASIGGTTRYKMSWWTIIKKGSYTCPNGGTLSGSSCVLTNPPTSICPNGYVDTGLSGAQACKKTIENINCSTSSSCVLTSYNPITNNNEDKYTLILGCEGTNTSLTYKDASGTNIYKPIGETTTAKIYNKGSYFDINFVEDGLTTTDTRFDPDNFRDGTYFEYKCLVKNNSDY
jgi:hypothetical protein